MRKFMVCGTGGQSRNPGDRGQKSRNPGKHQKDDPLTLLGSPHAWADRQQFGRAELRGLGELVSG
ncbi:MAG TPA: hypothetical protein VG122_03250, partial [Gemmata sp.]|nr:hypothetical protein [Gemmata sp.]